MLQKWFIIKNSIIVAGIMPATIIYNNLVTVLIHF
jgi:hypothetical protein